MSKPSPAILSRSIATLAATLLATMLAAPKVHAASLYWDGTGTGWDAIANWSTDPGLTTPDPAAVPGAADDAIFSISTVTTAQTVNLNANQAALGLSFLGTNTATTSLLGGGTNRTLSLGANGITVAAGAGAVTIGSATAGQNVALSLQGAQSWNNNGSSGLTLVNGVSLGVAGTNTLTLSGTGTGLSTISGVVASGTGTLAVNKTGTGTWVLGGANTYTGGTTVTTGTLRGTVAGSFGANTSAAAVTLAGGNLELFNDTGTTFTNTNTTVTANSTVTANRVTAAGTATTHTLGTLSIGGQTLSIARGANITGTAAGGITFGATTLTGNSTFAPGANTVLTLGAVGGAFSLTQNGAGTTVLSAAGTYTGGTIVSAGTLRGTVAASFGTNTTASAITLAGGNLELFNNTGTTFTNTNTTVTANSTVTANRSSAAATSTTHTLGTLSIGAQSLSVVKGGNISAGTGIIGGVTFGATTLTGDATFAPGASSVLTLGAVSGGFKLTQAGTGNGTTVLSAASTYTGGTTISGGILQLGNATAAGTATSIDFPQNGSGRLRINGGVTIGYNINIASGQAGATGEGLIQQVGTGQATVNGTITLSGLSGAGGVFVGGTATGSELVLNGPINGPNLGLSQREGRVIYKGGGTASDNGTTTLFSITNTALVGATNGIPIGLTPALGGSGNATLDLNGFNQTVAGLQLGNSGAGNNNLGTVNLGARTLTLNGNLATISTATANVTHVINATGTGALDVGAASRSFTVTDSLANDDLIINNAAITGSGGVTKVGNGTLVLNGVNVAGPLAVNAGTLATGPFGGVGSMTTGSLAFGPGATNLRMKVGAGGDLITTGGLTTGGTTTVNLNQLGGIIPNGTYNLINYTGTTPGLSGFTLAPVGHATASLVDTGTAIAVNITGNDRVIWGGTNNSNWSTGATGNWKLQSNSAVTDFIEADDVIFQDGATAGNVTIATNVAPSNVSFTNTTATTYSITGTGGIVGATGLTKSGNGTVVLATPNTYTGPTDVNAGTLELDHDAAGNVVLANTSAVNVAAGATLKLTRDDGAFNFNRNISGAGLVELNPHSISGGTTAHSINLADNTGFTGTLRLAAPATGTYRINGATAANLGSATIEVQSGAQVFTANNQTFNNPITIAGTGFADSAGNIGAIRLGDGANWAGNITIDGSARIGAHSATGTVSGNISGGNLSVNATNFNNSYTLIFTGNNAYGTTTIGGQNTQTGGVPSMRLNIGNGGTTGTLGSGNVVINGDGANGILGFDRSDGYTLLPGQTITAANGAGTIANSIVRTFVDIDTLGAGFSDNGNAITLGTAGINTGGTFRIAQARANATANITGALTAEKIIVASAQTGGVLNIGTGAAINANYVSAGETDNMSGTINQATGSTVNIIGQLRLGHFANNTSTYNMNGGVLQMTGASPTNSPSQANSGNDTSVGDNNLNNTNPATIVGGGIYLGISGTGIFNQNNGTVTTNWIVLDNRGDNGGGLNMADGIDRYNLANGTLNLRSNYGLIQRNNTAAVSFAGGTVRVDNSGTGTGTGANLTIPLDANITVSGNTTLDTNGAGNKFTLPRNVAGNGTLTLTGGGVINLSTTGFQNITPSLASSGTTASITKLGTGTTVLSGNNSGFTGGVTVSAGRLNVLGNLGASSVTVADAAAIGGEPSLASLTLGAATGATVFFDPNTAGSLNGGNLTVNGTSTVDFDTAPTGAGPYTVLSYATKSGTGTIGLANAASYRNAPVISEAGGNITVDVTGTKALTWTGTGGATWNVNSTTNWNDATLTADKFFAGDTVTFGDGPTAVAVAVNGGVSPWKTTVNSNTNNYTLTSSGNGISGPGSLEKLGSSTLTLSGANTYAGKTTVGGGILAYSAVNSLGNAGLNNSIALSGGGRLNYTGTTGIDLGTSRNIDVDTGGGIIGHSGTANVGITIPGSLTGSGSLKFSTTGTSTTASTVTNYSLTGSNAGYTGDITVEATANILSTLTLTSQAAVPNAASITVLHPAGSTTTNNANTLALTNLNLPAGTAVNLSAFLTVGNISQRSQVTSIGESSIDGSIKLTGNGGSVIQFGPTAGTLTINGNIGEATPGSFGVAATPATLFFRSGGNTVLNGTVNLPTANVIRVDDTGILTINSTGNIWAGTEVRSNSTLRLGIDNALPTGALLTIGQSTDAASSIVEMNGFDQTVNGLTSITGNGNSNRRITNSSSTQSTLTLNGSVNRTFGNIGTNTGGNITGNIAIVKNGTNTQTFAGPANTYTGNVTVNNGMLVAGGDTNSNALGSPTTPGRVVTVNTGGTLSFTTNNVFGNGQNNNNLPATVLNGGTLTSTRYNVLGNVTLNGATLTQAVTDSGAYEGFQFRGDVTVGGASASTISTTNGKANHLGPNTTFNVANATGNADSDLVVSAPLRNQSGDFGSGAGGLTKAGPGTLELSGVNTYTGPTVLAEGSLVVTGSIAASAATVDGGTLTGNGTLGTVLLNPLGTLAPGNAGPGTLTATSVSFAGGTFSLELNGTGAGQADRLTVSSSVSLTSNTPLTLTLGYSPVANVDSFVVVNNTGANPISTTGGLFTFAGTPLTEGAQFIVSGQQFAISYQGGDGNDVTVSAVPEPSISALIAGCGVLLGLQRRRRRSA